MSRSPAYKHPNDDTPLENVVDESQSDEDMNFQVQTERIVIEKIVQYLRENIRLKTILTLPFFIAANVLYISCDKPCPYNVNTDCLLWGNERVMWWFDKITMTASIFCVLIMMSLIFKILPKLVGFAAILNFLYLVFFFDTKLSFQRYGQAFALILLLEVSIFYILFGIVYWCIKCFKKSPKLTVIFLTLFFVVIPGITIYRTAGSSCKQWDKGLDNEEIDNSVGCQIPIPTVCLYDMLDGIFDFSISDCSSTKEYSKLVDIYPKAPIIGFPRVEYGSNEDKSYGKFQGYVLENVVPLQSFEDKAAENIEIFIDQRNVDNIQMKINVKRNETLVKERSQKKSEGLAKNMLVIFIDALSRPRLFKKLKKTIAWLEQFTDQKSQEREAFQFLKFHAITPMTDGNLMAAYFDLPYPSPPDPPKVPALTYAQTLKDNGYILGRSSDICLTSDLVQNSETLKYMENVPFDHEGNPLACDPNYHEPGNSLGFFKGPYAFKRRCAYGKDIFQHNMDYGTQFWRTYPEEKKLLWLDFLDAHEGTQEAVKYMDEPLVNFFNNLDQDNLLKDTTILFWSDHGLHYDIFPINLQNFNFRLERALPFMFLVLPHNLAVEYRDNIKENKQQLTTAFQVYNLLMAFGEGKDSPHLKNSFLQKLPSITCEDVPIASILRHQCFCTYPETPKDGDNNKHKFLL